jgi:hypothetical protein
LEILAWFKVTVHWLESKEGAEKLARRACTAAARYGETGEVAELTRCLAQGMDLQTQLVEECVAFSTSLAFDVLHAINLGQAPRRGQPWSQTRKEVNGSGIGCTFQTLPLYGGPTCSSRPSSQNRAAACPPMRTGLVHILYPV